MKGLRNWRQKANAGLGHWLHNWLLGGLASAAQLAAAQSAQPSPAAACLSPPTLHVAVIPKNARSLEVGQQNALLEALQAETGLHVQWVPAASYGAVIEGMLAGRIHLAELGPASYAMLRQYSGRFAPFAAFSNTTQLMHYHSVLVVAVGSKLERFEELRGKVVAMTDPASTSGAVVPRAAVRQLTGQGVEAFFARVVYTGTHDKALRAVSKNKVDAAFVSSSQLPSGVAKEIWRSRALMSNPYVWDEQLCPPLRDAIARAFLSQPQRIRPWLDSENFRYVVPASAADYQGMEQWLQSAKPHSKP